MMFLRSRRLVLDREIGLVFDWRKGHGTFFRLILAMTISLIFCGVLFIGIEIKKPAPPPLQEQGKAVTVMNLALPENRWLADLFERESPYVAQWDLQDDRRLQVEMTKALGMTTPAEYVPELAEVVLPEMVKPLVNLPGMSALPEPELISWPKIARQPGQWWIEFDSPGHEWSDFSMPWENQKNLISAGQTWGFLIGLDPAGGVRACIELEGRGDQITAELSEGLQGAPFPEDQKAQEIRWWKVVARAVNRNASDQ